MCAKTWVGKSFYYFIICLYIILSVLLLFFKDLFFFKKDLFTYSGEGEEGQKDRDKQTPH